MKARTNKPQFGGNSEANKQVYGKRLIERPHSESDDIGPKRYKKTNKQGVFCGREMNDTKKGITD
jgi:hypothetical protein